MATAAGILFCDVKGYSNLKYHEFKAFHKDVCQALAKIINKGQNEEPYLYKKTWGDGIVLVHKNLYKLALVALDIRDYFNNRDYEQDSQGILNGKNLLSRIAIHFGEFETVDDPIDGAKSCFGKGIILPARIEPVTDAGHVWATKLATQYLYDKQKADGFTQLCWRYRGHIPLAKEFDTNHIWQILKRGGKDADGKEGTAKEPTVPSQYTKSRKASPAPEKYEAIDEDAAKKIKALTGRDPRDKNNDITVCSKIPEQNECPTKAKAALAISVMERDGESAMEEMQISYWIQEIHKSTKRIVDYFDGSEKDLRWTQIWDLKQNVKNLFGCFDKFKHDDSWPDSKPWPQSFLSWRLQKTGTENPENAAELFIMSMKKFQDFCKKNYPSEKGISNFNPNSITYEVDECLRYILAISEDLNIHLNTMGNKRLDAIKKAAKDEFVGFDRFKFARHLKNLANNLVSRGERIAGVWS